MQPLTNGVILNNLLGLFDPQLSPVSNMHGNIYPHQLVVKNRNYERTVPDALRLYVSYLTYLIRNTL